MQERWKRCGSRWRRERAAASPCAQPRSARCAPAAGWKPQPPRCRSSSASMLLRTAAIEIPRLEGQRRGQLLMTVKVSKQTVHLLPESATLEAELRQVHGSNSPGCMPLLERICKTDIFCRAGDSADASRAERRIWQGACRRERAEDERRRGGGNAGRLEGRCEGGGAGLPPGHPCCRARTRRGACAPSGAGHA